MFKKIEIFLVKRLQNYELEPFILLAGFKMKHILVIKIGK